jgi:cation diffusion facilitator CzcD-associated flavoprotein CzcO
MMIEYPCHARGTVLGEYYQQYARHFGLDRHIHFNTTVTSIVRREDEKTGGKWIVSYYKDADDSDEDDEKPVAEEKEFTAGEEGRVLRQEVFDKVVHAVGSETMAKYPDIEGLEKFEGRFIHGQAFKR